MNFRAHFFYEYTTAQPHQKKNTRGVVGIHRQKVSFSFIVEDLVQIFPCRQIDESLGVSTNNTSIAVWTSAWLILLSVPVVEKISFEIRIMWYETRLVCYCFACYLVSSQAVLCVLSSPLLNRSFYPTTSVHPAVVLILHPINTEIKVMWSQTAVTAVRQSKPNSLNTSR